ncbi:MAG: DUF5615 family PIN-like protein [Anaerolineaceae bacterium]|nr:DUF5615 family PIN-like protein [Anaerolineaceae bacterium]
MKFLADENFNNDIIRGVWRRIPDVVIVRVQDTEIAGADDVRVLEYAVEQSYILLTHDVNTVPKYFYERIKQGLPVPSVFLVHKQTPVGQIVDALEEIIHASDASDWDSMVVYIPLS